MSPIDNAYSYCEKSKDMAGFTFSLTKTSTEFTVPWRGCDVQGVSRETDNYAPSKATLIGVIVVQYF
ncbi:hypothetical protein BEST7613_5008 [Synechocystis sp. PCC 6803]|nr:hypothetical protein BEST7613_5008 [Synechocystis sp. PCC 6803] [Bacillus subtilis BEST7613]